MPSPTMEQQVARCSLWPQRFSHEEWALYRRVIAEARSHGIPFAIGGGLAAMTYAGQWRNTKDLDVYIRECDREEMIRIVTALGLGDYYDVQPYDRKWIYRSHRGDIIVDLIWAMANQRSKVENSWLEGPLAEAGGERFRLLAPEAALWSKLYVFQRDRSDWPDALNLLYGIGPELDWRRLLGQLGPDAPLLAALLIVFDWLCPARARQLPSWLWQELGLHCSGAKIDLELVRHRAGLLDSRDWFAPLLEERDSPALEQEGKGMCAC